jgi:hypothetical protein
MKHATQLEGYCSVCSWYINKSCSCLCSNWLDTSELSALSYHTLETVLQSALLIEACVPMCGKPHPLDMTFKSGPTTAWPAGLLPTPVLVTQRLIVIAIFALDCKIPVTSECLFRYECQWVSYFDLPGTNTICWQRMFIQNHLLSQGQVCARSVHAHIM